MTDAPPLPFAQPTRPRTWRVQLADGSERTITATACRVECACLVFAEASGMTAAFAAGTWSAVELEPTP